MSKQFKTVLSIICFLVFLLIGFTFGLKIYQSKLQASIPSNWKTYTDKSVGFSIRYPNTWSQETNRVFVPRKCPNEKTLVSEDCVMEEVIFEVYNKDANDSLITAIRKLNTQDFLGNTEILGKEQIPANLVKLGAIVTDNSGMAVHQNAFIPLSKTKILRVYVGSWDLKTAELIYSSFTLL